MTNPRASLASLMALAFSLTGCGPGANGDADEKRGMIPMGEADAGTIDTSELGITAFVKDGRYLGWLAEPAAHQSAGPHGGKVRAFFNPVLASSMKAGNSQHPAGSVVVKELLEDDGSTLRGHALNVRVDGTAGKSGWLFYEGFTKDDYRDTYYGIAHPTCHGCHEGGVDYVLIAVP